MVEKKTAEKAVKKSEPKIDATVFDQHGNVLGSVKVADIFPKLPYPDAYKVVIQRG